MPKVLYLLRHCTSVANEKGINDSIANSLLSEKGRAESVVLIPLLSHQTYDLIVVSPLQRTTQTITPYLHTLSHKPQIMIEVLITERNLGIFTNTIRGDKKISDDIHKKGKSRVEWRPEGGESIIDIYGRADKFLKKIKEKSEENILICGHKIFLRCLELLLTDKPLTDESFYQSSPPLLKNGELRRYKINIS